VFKKGFTSGDINENRHCVIMPGGDFFTAFSLEFSGKPNETISSFTAHGRWERNTDGKYPEGVLATLRVTRLKWNSTSPPTYGDVRSGKVSAGEVFSGAEWLDWLIEVD